MGASRTCDNCNLVARLPRRQFPQCCLTSFRPLLDHFHFGSLPEDFQTFFLVVSVVIAMVNVMVVVAIVVVSIVVVVVEMVMVVRSTALRPARQ